MSFPCGHHCRRLAKAHAVGLLIALAACWPAHAGPACKLKALELPVTMIGARAVVTVGINGSDVPLTLDSGAFFSFLTDAAAQQLGLPTSGLRRNFEVEGLTGKVITRMTTVKRLRLQKGEIPDVEFLVGGNEPGSGTMGLLGRNFLAFTDTEYDLAHGMVRLMFPEGDCKEVNPAYWAGDTPVSELALQRDPSFRTPAIIANVEVNGEAVRALFDTGARTTLSLAAARRAGIKDADMKSDGMMYGTGRGQAKAWIAPVRKVTLGNESIENSLMSVGDFYMSKADMLVGIDFFLSHRVYISKVQHRMFFTYAGGPVFSLAVASADHAAAPSADPQSDADADQPKDAAGYARRGAAFAARRAYASALADLDRACELSPDVADFFVRRAEVHRAMKHTPEALRDFDTALRLDPANAEARLMRAAHRGASKDQQGALDDLQALDKSIAPQANMRRDMGQMYTLLDRQDLALAQWSHWISAHRNEEGLDQALNARCWSRAMLGIELDQALKDCDEALDLQPKLASYLDSRAWVHLRRGELRDAIADFDRALKTRPKEPWTLYGRGLARTQLGQDDEGRADIETARSLLPSIDAETARYKLSQSDFADRAAARK